MAIALRAALVALLVGVWSATAGALFAVLVAVVPILPVA